uniref:Microtubule-associated protein Jupiter n=1 Tax=Timema bartmani TaxID=61472 RepID=A0A7R9I042_9NEOP|nr:unnamed protein product [Timema bartmani]
MAWPYGVLHVVCVWLLHAWCWGVLFTAHMARNPVTGAGMVDRDSLLRRSAKKRGNATRLVSKDGNPVTGEGYVATNGEKAPAEPAVNNPVVNGTTASKPASAQPQAPVQQQQRARVPPGGFSSGLW